MLQFFRLARLRVWLRMLQVKAYTLTPFSSFLHISFSGSSRIEVGLQNLDEEVPTLTVLTSTLDFRRNIITVRRGLYEANIYCNKEIQVIQRNTMHHDFLAFTDTCEPIDVTVVSILLPLGLFDRYFSCACVQELGWCLLFLIEVLF